MRLLNVGILLSEVFSKLFNVTYASIDSIQEGVGSSQIVPLVKKLAARGLKISLVTCEKVNPSEDLQKEIADCGIHWIILKYGRNGSIGGLFRLFRLVRCLPAAEIVHARSDIPAVAAAIRYPRTKILWDVRSLWADQRRVVDSKGWNVFTFFVARILERIAARRSFGMVTLTNSVVPVLQCRYIRLPEVRDVIPTCTQLDKFFVTPMPAAPLVCLLAGTFNEFYDLGAIKNIISELRELQEIRVIWARPTESTSMALNVGEDVVISASYKEMPLIMSQSHFGIIVCKDENLEALTAVAPTKVAEFLASGRPILISKGIGDLDSVIKKYQVGISVDTRADHSVSIHDFIGLLNDPEIHRRCRRSAEDLFSLDEATLKYMGMYREMNLNV